MILILPWPEGLAAGNLIFCAAPNPRVGFFLNRIAFVRLLLQCRFELMFEKAVGVPSLKLEIMEMSFWETV